LKKNMISLTKENDGLAYDWLGHRVYCNPPYSEVNCRKWCRKIFEERNRAEMIALLISLNKLSNNYFHEYIVPYARVILIKGRVSFEPLAGQKKSSNPLGSVLCIIESPHIKERLNGDAIAQVREKSMKVC